MQFIYKKGFSVIELLIVVFIFVILVSIVSAPLVKNYKNRLLLQSADDVISVLNKARSNTLASINSEQYGVNFEADKVTLFTGSTYTQNAISNKVMELQKGIEVNLGQTLLNGSATSVVFDRLTGATNQYGTITLYITTDTLSTKIINIEKTGSVRLITN